MPTSIHKGTRIQVLYLGVVHKLQTLVIQNMLIMGEARDMSAVNPNTLWSSFHADISVTACHIPSKLYTLN